MDITVNYRIGTGKYGGSGEVCEWTMKSPDAEFWKAYTRAVMTGEDFEDVPELQRICADARREIGEYELKKLVSSGEDYFVLECLGETEMDPDELNGLVRKKDPHALRFFGLEGMSQADLEKWDSAEAGRIPLVKEFDGNFKPRNPFECGYTLDVWLPDDAVPGDEEIEEYLREVLSAGDADLAEEAVLEQSGNYSGDLLKKSLEIAGETGCREFIERNGS